MLYNIISFNFWIVCRYIWKTLKSDLNIPTEFQFTFKIECCVALFRGRVVRPAHYGRNFYNFVKKVFLIGSCLLIYQKFKRFYPNNIFHLFKPWNDFYNVFKKHISLKVENILKGSLDLIPSPSPSVKIQIIGRKVYLR